MADAKLTGMLKKIGQVEYRHINACYTAADDDIRKQIKDGNVLATARDTKPLYCAISVGVWVCVFWFYVPRRVNEERSISLRLHPIYPTTSIGSYFVYGDFFGQ